MQVGNARQRHVLRDSSVMSRSAHCWRLFGEPLCGLRADLGQASLSRVAPPVLPRRSAPQLFRVLLFRRLGLPLPLTSRTCRCGRPLDPSGHHRVACVRAGVLGPRGFALESMLARICREAGGRVTTNIMVRDLDLEHLQGPDGRRLEVVADGLPLFGGAQLALDTTLVSALKGEERCCGC